MKDNFIEELRELCKKYDVSLRVWGGGTVTIKCGYREEFLNNVMRVRKKLDTTGKIV